MAKASGSAVAMRTKLVAVIVGAISVLAPYAVAEESRPGIYVLIAAHSSQIALLRDLSGATKSGERIEVTEAALLRVRLTSVKAVIGELPPGVGSLDVEMTATQRAAIAAHKQIYVLLDLEVREHPRVVYWGVPEAMLCIPHKLLPGTAVEGQFGALHTYDNRDCASVD